MLPKNEAALREKYSWAIDIIHKHLSSGIERLCDEKFLKKRYSDFLSKHDPIYGDLLAGMGDEALAKTFVSYWTIAQTMATQSRFWLENAVAQIIVHQVKRFGRQATHVYSQSMLAEGFLDTRVEVDQIGEDTLEHLSSAKPWRPNIQSGALDAVDLIVGRQERERVVKRNPLMTRAWELNDQETSDRDRSHLREVAQSIAGSNSAINLNCNLIVVEPHKTDGKPHLWAFRYVNPKTISSHAARKQERANLLRLYALLVQEKILRSVDSIRVAVAELLPRYSAFDRQDRYPDYFSSYTYWSSKQLWDFIDVPFEVVTIAISDSAKDFRTNLKNGLRRLLPNDSPSSHA